MNHTDSTIILARLHLSDQKIEENQKMKIESPEEREAMNLETQKIEK